MFHNPAGERNKEPILDVLKQYYDADATIKVLEIASGPGTHVLHFANYFKKATFLPSECEKTWTDAIDDAARANKVKNVLPAALVDVATPLGDWDLPTGFRKPVDVMLNINMIHISSNDAVDGLFRAAGFKLKPHTGRLFTYGPYGFHGKISPESNVRFDKSLRGQNPEWGLRDADELKKKAEANGLTLSKVHAMPANNHMLVFEKDAPSLTISDSGVSWH